MMTYDAEKWLNRNDRESSPAESLIKANLSFTKSDFIELAFLSLDQVLADNEIGIDKDELAAFRTLERMHNANTNHRESNDGNQHSI